MIIIIYGVLIFLLFLVFYYHHKCNKALSLCSKLINIIDTTNKINKEQCNNLKSIVQYINIFAKETTEKGALILPEYYWKAFKERKLTPYIESLQKISKKTDEKLKLLNRRKER